MKVHKILPDKQDEDKHHNFHKYFHNSLHKYLIAEPRQQLTRRIIHRKCRKVHIRANLYTFDT